MRTFIGLVTSPWRAEDSGRLWALTLGTAAFTVLLSKSSVWLANSYADFFGQAVGLIKAEDDLSLRTLGAAGLLWGGIVLARALPIGLRHSMSSNINRLATGWMVEQFNQACYDKNQSHMLLTSDQTIGLPGQLDQRIQECPRDLQAGFIGLTMGALGTLSSLWFVGNALYQKSGPIDGLDFLGPFASSFAFAIALSAAYVVPNTWVATKIGRVLQTLNLQRQSHDGNWRSELANTFNRSVQVASSAGEQVQLWINQNLYKSVNDTWFKQTLADSGFVSFNHLYQEISRKLIPYVPFFPAAIRGNVSFEDYIAGSELTRGLINDMSWFIQVMPNIANIRANASRLIEVAEARETVNDKAAFYRKTGVSEFAYARQNPAFGMRVKNL